MMRLASAPSTAWTAEALAGLSARKCWLAIFLERNAGSRPASRAAARVAMPASVILLPLRKRYLSSLKSPLPRFGHQ